MLLPILIILICAVAFFKKIDAYSAFIEGSKEGIHFFYTMFPSMLAMLFAVNILRSSGLFDIIIHYVQMIIPIVPAEIVPLALFRPISGSGSMAVLLDIFKTLGPDSLAGKMGSVIQGSTDTTLYVITMYFGYIQVKNIKNTLKIGLFADLVGISLAILLTYIFIS